MFKALIGFLRRLFGLDGESVPRPMVDALPTVAMVQLLDVSGAYPARSDGDAARTSAPEAAFAGENLLGSIHHFAGRFETSGWNCDGRSAPKEPISPNGALAAIMGNQFGPGTASTFVIPDLRGTIPICTDYVQPPGQRDTAKGTLTLNWAICAQDNIAPNTPIVGMLRPMVNAWLPSGWLACNGQSVSVEQYSLLFDAIGTTFGGDGTTNFTLPNLRGRAPVGIGTLADGTQIAMGQTIDDKNVPGLGLNIVIAITGPPPPHGPGYFEDRSLLGEVQVLAFSNPELTTGWSAPCDGRTLSVRTDGPLFAVIGKAYGGDGVTTYALPDLRGRAMAGYALS